MGATFGQIAALLLSVALLLMGNGVVANVVLEQTKGQGAGWIVISAGLALPARLRPPPAPARNRRGP